MIESQWIMPADKAMLEEALTIRMEVFCDEQGFSPSLERDRLDDIAIHLLLTVDGVRAATGRLLQKPDRSWVIGRVAVRASFRRQGLGDMLMRMLIRKARDLGAGDIHVDSQVQAIPFYASLGFVPAEDGEHMDEHVPHRQMVLPAGVEPASQCGHH